MNKEEKTKLYSELVEAVKKTYLPRVELEKKKYGGIFLTDSDNLCEEINLYTYWQGVNYAKKTPPIKYLLVAQDWGALPVGQARFDYEKKLIAIKNGDNVSYYEKNQFDTDDNLVELFKVLGYKAIDKHLYDDLFFTNFCLGYRIGNSSGEMTKDFMMHDAKNFRRLCEILEPKNILCLGKLTFECVYESLKGDGERKPKGFRGSYNKFIETYGVNPITVHISNSHTTRIFPLAHPGAMGMLNRAPGIKSDFPPDATKEEKKKKQSETKDRRLKVQKSDWQRVKDAVQK